MIARCVSILLAAACLLQFSTGRSSAQVRPVEVIVRVDPGGPAARALRAASEGAQRESLQTWNAQSISALGLRIVRRDKAIVGAQPAGVEQRQGQAQDEGAEQNITPFEMPLAAYVIQLNGNVSADSLMNAWRSREGVQYVQFNHRYEITGDAHSSPPGYRHKTSQATDRRADPEADSLFHHSVVAVRQAWSVTKGNPEIRVGFVDTGVYFDHPDLVGAFWVNAGEDIDGDGVYSAADLNGIDDDGNGLIDDVSGYDFVDRPETVTIGDFRLRDPDASDDGSGHGTAIAGVIGAREGNGVGIAGIAPHVTMVPLRAFGSDGRGDDDDIAAAILYAAEMGLDVLNLSFGDSYYSPLLHEAIRYASNRGTIVVASAGNVGGDSPHYPSDYPEVISTVWLTAEGTGPAARATYGTGVDIGAPGSGIYTTLQPGAVFGSGDGSLYGRLSGSSLSAPIVSGTVALVRSANVDISAAGARSAVLGSAVDIDALGWDHRTGAGLVNAGAAVVGVVPSRVELATPKQDDAIGGDRIAIVGSVAHPSLASFAIDYAVGYTNLNEDAFVPVSTARKEQVLDDTLAVWNTTDLIDGPYTLRLRVAVRSGQTIEERRRIYIDNTPPQIRLAVIAPAIDEGESGVFVELETDDLTEVSVSIGTEASDHFDDQRSTSDRLARRHGVTVTAGPVRNETAYVHVTARNRAGLQADTTFLGTIPRVASNAARFSIEEMGIRSGFALPFLVDFDGDGLAEILYNRYIDGELGDTVSVVEYPDWNVVGEIISNIFPRDAGDTDGDGLLELLGQVSAATIILEQDAPNALPGSPVFVDTTGLSNPTGDLAVWGARLADTNGNGRDEIVTHNTQVVRLLERTESGAVLKAALENPTAVSGGELATNGIAQPEMLIDDLDQNGRVDILFGDTDGDLVMYESAGGDLYELRWQAESSRYNAGRHFASGRIAAAGAKWFAAATTNWIGQRTDREYEADATILTVYQASAQGSYVPTFVRAFPGEIDSHSSLASIDIDGDGADELVVVAAPDMYIFHVASGDLIFHANTESLVSANGGVRSARLIVGDVDGDGDEDLIAGGYSNEFLLFRQESAAYVPAPVLLDAYALDAASVYLSWRAPAVDSVRILSRVVPGPFDVDTTMGGESGEVILRRSEEREYVLQSWRSGLSSAMSRRATVRPHNPARLETLTYVSPDQITLDFGAPLLADNSDARLWLTSDSLSLTPAYSASSIVVGIPRARPDSIAWTGLRDAEGTPLADSIVAFDFASLQLERLHLSSWSLRPPREVDLLFSKRVHPSSATNPTNYRVQPVGLVESVVALDDSGRLFRVSVIGLAVGSTGLDAYLYVDGVAAVDGADMDPDGNVIALSEAAEGLAGAYAFPNPVSPDHDQLFVGGLPNGSEVQIFGSNGAHVASLREVDNDGGVAWNLRDEAGALVPSGIYLLQIRLEGEPPVLLKAAIIR